MNAHTSGLHHLGLAVRDLDQTTGFFTDLLGWKEIAPRDESYPRSIISDGALMLTLWQVDHALDIREFDRRANVGLHHVAIRIESEQELEALAEKVRAWPGVTMEFMPEPLAGGPRRHMMFREPGGIRIELIWPGA